MRDQERAKFLPAVGQWWSLNGNEGVITKMLPGGGGNMGIAVFDGDVPPAHVCIMLKFGAWSYLPDGPKKTRPLPPPCTCVTLEGGIVIADGCAAHDARSAKDATVIGPRRMSA